MGTLVLDECLQNLFYAQETMKEWIPMTEYEVLFEATENEETAEKVANNERVSEKSVGFVRKAINAVLEIIKKIYNAIKDLIDRCTMSGDERDAFDAFREQMKNDPDLKNKKVTVSDFRKINQEYDKLIQEVEQNIRLVKNNENHPVDELISTITNKLKGTVGAATMIITADAAVKIADSNVEVAKKLSQLLKNEEGIMAELSKTLGKKGANAFKRDIDAAAKCTMLHRLKVKLFRYKYDSLADAIHGTINSLTHAGFQDVKDLKKIKKMIAKNRRDGVIDRKTAKQHTAEVNDALRRAKYEKRSAIAIDADFLKNEYTGPMVKTVIKAAIDAKLDLTTEELKTKIRSFLRIRNTDKNYGKRSQSDIYKDAFSFFVGTKNTK